MQNYLKWYVDFIINICCKKAPRTEWIETTFSGGKKKGLSERDKGKCYENNNDNR